MKSRDLNNNSYLLQYENYTIFDGTLRLRNAKGDDMTLRKVCYLAWISDFALLGNGRPVSHCRFLRGIHGL